MRQRADVGWLVGWLVGGWVGGWVGRWVVFKALSAQIEIISTKTKLKSVYLCIFHLVCLCYCVFVPDPEQYIYISYVQGLTDFD